MVLIAGIATSRTGWVESSFAPAPAVSADIAANATWLDLKGTAGLAFLPGVSVSTGLPDVMRSEEIRIFGAGIKGDATVILPGHHTKWVRIENGRIAAFWTFLTGEMTHLLLRDSIISGLIPTDPLHDEAGFAMGIETALDVGSDGGLLRRLFSARSLVLFDKLAPTQIASYLYGLALTTEAREAFDGLAKRTAEIVILDTGERARRYATVLNALGCNIVTLRDPDPAGGFTRVHAELVHLRKTRQAV
jgi:2-dehydro-3-deoxygalactonokinase